MEFTRTWTGNWENALFGLRHPMESYARSDSEFGIEHIEYTREKEIINKDEDLAEYAVIGQKDMDLAQRMIKAGTPNDKFLRQIFVSVDITAPLYWWKEMDTYKVGTTANSTSTMHKLASTPITLDCFEIDDYEPRLQLIDPVHIDTRISQFIDDLEQLRQLYNQTKDKKYWKELIRWLPAGWKQTRSWSANYSVLRNIIHWRQSHKLSEWSQFIDWCRTLPYSKELLFYNNKIVSD